MSAGLFRSAEAAAAVERQYRGLLDRWPVPSVQHMLPTCQGPTFVLSCGPEGAPPVLLLHGAQANSASWMADAALWSRSFRLHAVDMIGEAGLSAPVRPPLDGDAHARWLDDLFAGLGLSSAALVGTSLGGWLALDHAVRRPGKVDALALICPAGIGRQKNFLLRNAPLLLLGRRGERRMRAKVFGPIPAEIPEAARPLAEMMATIGRTIRPRVVRIPRLSDEELERLRMPILAVVGGRDALIDSRETRDRLGRHAPRAEVAFIEEGYHFLPGQEGRVMDFLERHVGREGASGSAAGDDLAR